jgi:CheY-like chemotaxis protein
LLAGQLPPRRLLAIAFNERHGSVRGHIAGRARNRGRGATTAQAGADSTQGGRGDILVVEDNEQIGAFSTQLLAELAFETTWAPSVEAGLQRPSENPHPYSAVFSDVVMPGMNGVELGPEIRRRKPELPVILTSGYSHVLAREGSHGFELHKDKRYTGEHEPIVDQELWDEVQARLAAKAPPRKHASNDRQDALLEGLLMDPQSRPMVPTFTCKGTRRYRYYETRRDLAGNGRPAATRFAMRSLDRHIVDKLRKLLADEHALRRWAQLKDAQGLKALFDRAAQLSQRLPSESHWAETMPTLVTSVQVRTSALDVSVSAASLGMPAQSEALSLELPLPTRKPFRETKLRLEATSQRESDIDRALIKLLREAHQVRQLVLAAPSESLNVIAAREGRCRKQMAKLLRLSWLSPRIVEAVVDDRLADRFDRRHLLEMAVPSSWADQHELLGLA